MVGKGRHPILGLRSPDPLLSMAGTVGLAAAAGTALIVDLVENRADPHRRTLRDLADDGPSLSELSPGRSGIAMIRGGGIDASAAVDMLGRLGGQWPVIAVRVGDGQHPFPVVPAIPLYPGRLYSIPDVSHCVWQPVGTASRPPAPGPVLPRLRPGTLRRILGGHLPRRSRWVDAWRPIWEMPWA